MKVKQGLSIALDVGERMLRSGGEVSRVEDTISRICRAYGANQVDVFVITSSIVTTVRNETAHTETRRILSQSYDLNRLDLLNQLSRFICEKVPDQKTVEAELKKIDDSRQYSFRERLLIYALISSSFSLFFGGSAKDAIASGLIGLFLCVLETFMRKQDISRIFISFICAFTAGLLAALAQHFNFADSADLICIGNIMLLIPGVALTNSIRDLFQGDTFAGMARFFEAIFIACIVVLGVTMSAHLF